MKIDRVRAVADRVADLGGVARPTRLVREGHGRRQVSEAVSRGLVTRVRRDWIASPGADEYLVAAARTGTVLSCVTAAERLGLWVHERPPQPHVAHPGRGKIAATAAVVHWQRAIVPRHPDLLEDGIENVLMTVAACRPYEQARAVWESALNKRLVDRPRLERLPWVGVARRLAQEVTPWADSGLETYFVTRLGWLRLPIRTQIWIEGHRVDSLIGERLVVQIDGGHHVGRQRSEDIRHDAALMLLGFHVIRVSYEQVMHRWPEVQEQIMQAVAQGLHRA
ncbi:endonuclease domain-containing protein [Microbacterium enclense]|uniref:endonuclease domain-containing protein n=1 Tax=Microbacterium enclense TaxID=993073 RepID=UPI003F7F8DC1